jgi:hyaluronan synthase
MFPEFIKSTFSIIIVLILLTPAVVGYVLHIRLEAITDFAISIYGIYSLVYLMLQIIFGEINSRNIKKDVETRDLNWREYGVGLVVVGYNEEKDLLRRCLESIKNSDYQNIHRIVFVIDGNSETDQYMADIYKEVMNNNVIKIDYLFSDRKEIDYSIYGKNDICIMQPHHGKREGLYTGFKLLMQDPNIKVIVTTDSDTILNKSAIKELTYQCHHEDVGAVAGQIDIWNTSESLLSHIVAYRYWFSFNLERACESFWRTVMCVAGPMACYKVDILKEIIDEWYNQTFLGQRCTFGDDRHLTNRILLKGKKVIYTKYAKGYTDTPSNWSQYLRQQTRWSKSYFREFLFNMQSVHLHPLWMCYELLYNVLYFFLLMYWSIYLMYFGSIYQQSIAILITVIIGIVKSLYGVIKTKNIRFLFFYLYSFVYFFMIIPAKITALVTLWDMSWGTRGKTVNWLSTYWSFIIWVSIMTGGFAYTIYKNHVFNISNKRYLIAFVGWISFVGFVVVTCIVEFVCRKLKKCSNELEIDILHERKSTSKASCSAEDSQ